MTATQQPPVVVAPARAPVTQAAVATALGGAPDEGSAAAALAVLFVFTLPQARMLVATFWPPDGRRVAPWRLTAGSPPALWQAAYVMTAVQRIRDAVDTGKSFEQAVAQEQVYAAQHASAQKKRALALVQVRRAKRQYGRLLGWKAHAADGRVTPACRIADGANFNAATGPWPGTAHGGTCRCTVVHPFPTSRIVVTEWIKAGLGDHAEGAA
jgi:hypothetical protein